MHGHTRELVHDKLTRVFERHPSVLVAVSGGIDSTALLHICAESRLSNTLLHVAHVNHNVREDSDRDEQFVRSLANEYHFQFHLLRLPRAPHGENFESWARAKRYEWFRDICQEYNLSCTFTAHTSDDVVETMLMRLVSNKDPRSILEYDERRLVYRPLLNTSKEVLSEYLTDNNHSYVHDQSNDDSSFLRNKVRNELLPVLRNLFGKQVDRALHTRALTYSSDLSIIDELADSEIQTLAQEEWGSRQWLNSFRSMCGKYELPFRLRLIQRVLKPHIGYNLGLNKAAEVERLLAGKITAVQLPGNYSIKRKEGGWLLELQGE